MYHSFIYSRYKNKNFVVSCPTIFHLSNGKALKKKRGHGSRLRNWQERSFFPLLQCIDIGIL